MHLLHDLIMAQPRINHHLRARFLTQLQPLLPRINTHNIHPQRPRKLHPQMPQPATTPHNREPLARLDARNLDAPKNSTPCTSQRCGSRKTHALR
jgi:hypothetical protein